MKIYVIKLIILSSCIFFMGFRKEEFRSYKQYRELWIQVFDGKNPSDRELFVKLEKAFARVEKSLWKEKKRRKEREENFKSMEKEAEKLEQMLFNIGRQLARIPRTDNGDLAYQQILQTQLKEQLKEIDGLLAKKEAMIRKLSSLKEFISPYKLKIEKIGKILFEKMNGSETIGRIPAGWNGAGEMKGVLAGFSRDILNRLEKEQLSVFHLYTQYKMVSFSLELLNIKTRQMRKQILKRFSSLAPTYLNPDKNSSKTCPLIPSYFYP